MNVLTSKCIDRLTQLELSYLCRVKSSVSIITMPNNKTAKPPASKKAKVDEMKVQETMAVDVKIAEDGEVPAEEEFFEPSPAKTPTKQAEGVKTLIAPSAMAEANPKKKSNKVQLKMCVIPGIGAFFYLDKGDKSDVYPEKYLRDIVVGNVEIVGLEEFMTTYGVVPEVSVGKMSIGE